MASNSSLVITTFLKCAFQKSDSNVVTKSYIFTTHFPEIWIKEYESNVLTNFHVFAIYLWIDKFLPFIYGLTNQTQILLPTVVYDNPPFLCSMLIKLFF